MPKYTSIQETAYNYVRNKVLTGQLQPNVLYSETKMAAEIHISRTPMKDALVRLSQDRFIDIIPSKGFCLHKMSEEDIWHTYQARTAVEGFCAMQLAQHRDEGDGQAAIRALEGCLTDMSRLLAEMSQRKVSLEELLERDLQFHQALVDYVQNTELASSSTPIITGSTSSPWSPSGWTAARRRPTRSTARSWTPSWTPRTRWASTPTLPSCSTWRAPGTSCSRSWRRSDVPPGGASRRAKTPEKALNWRNV